MWQLRHISSWCTMNCWRLLERGGCLKTLERKSLHWMNILLFSGSNWLTRFLNISVYFLCYIKCDVLVWKYFNFSLSLAFCRLWFLSFIRYKYCNTSEQPLNMCLFVCLLSGSWWWKSDGNYGTRKHWKKNQTHECSRTSKSSLHALKKGKKRF